MKPQHSSGRKRRFFQSMNFRIAILVSTFSLIVSVPVAIFAEMELVRISMTATRDMERELTQMVAKKWRNRSSLDFPAPWMSGSTMWSNAPETAFTMPA